MKGSGGTDGGVWTFLIGFALSAAGVYLFLDSVRVTTGHGWLSGMLGARGGHGMWETTSFGILFVPILLGLIALFFDARMRWAWWLTGLGLLVIIVEILSRVRFMMNIKTTHLLGMFLLFAAGVGLMLRSYRDAKRNEQTKDESAKEKSPSEAADVGASDGDES